GVADREALLRFGAIGGANINPQIDKLHGVVPLRLLDEVDRLAAHDANDVPAFRQKPDSLADEHLRVPAADRRDVHETLVVDVLDDDADFVDVSVEQDGGAARWVHFGDAVARDVRPNILGKLLGLGAPHAG